MDQNNVLAVLAAALAPYLAQHMNQSGGNPSVQSGGSFGSPQTGGAPNTAFSGNQQTAQAQQSNTAPNSNMFGNAQQGTQSQVTADMVQQLITPLVSNEQVKQALTQQMQAMGIQNLPDATPAQLPELYQRFQEVDKQARAAGLIGGQPQGGTPNII